MFVHSVLCEVFKNIRPFKISSSLFYETWSFNKENDFFMLFLARIEDFEKMWTTLLFAFTPSGHFQSKNAILPIFFSLNKKYVQFRSEAVNSIFSFAPAPDDATGCIETNFRNAMYQQHEVNDMWSIQTYHL